MNVLLRIRGDVDRFPGGDYIQLLETKSALEKLGVKCTVAPGVDHVAGTFDVVHLFNTTRIQETYSQFCSAKARGWKVVLSPIWHSLEAMRRFYGHLYHLPLFFPIKTYLAAKELFYAHRSALGINLQTSLRFSARQRELVEQSDAILPNSQTELEILQHELRASPKISFISPLGLKVFSRVPEQSERRDLICAGRIEPRKNQLAVIRAFKKLPRNGQILRLYGQTNASHSRHTNSVLNECVPGWIEYGGVLSQEELMSACAKSRVAILMSFFETFGLTALEGLSTGANLCLSDTPYNRGIYGGHATYADPFSIDSIAAALGKCLALPLSAHDDFLATYTWENAARTTLQAYEHVVCS